MVTRVKHMFGYDDTLDAFGVHGAGGTLGALLTGVFATNADQRPPINGKVVPLGLVDGNARQILNQAIGVADRHRPRRCRYVLILKICDALIGVRVDPDDEETGPRSQRTWRRRLFLEA